MKDKLWFFAGYHPSSSPRPHGHRPRRRLDRTYNQDVQAKLRHREHHRPVGPQGAGQGGLHVERPEARGPPALLDGTSNPTANYAINDVSPNYGGVGHFDYTP